MLDGERREATAMTYYVTARTYSGEQAKEADTPTMALAWADEFRVRGAKSVYFRDETRTYTETALEALVEAQRALRARGTPLN
jgi:hypothetical protein